MIADLYVKFKEHIKQCDDKKSFNTVIENEILTPSMLLTVLSKMQSEAIDIQEKGIIEFLWANCFNVVYPQMFKKGHDFIYSEKLHLAGYLLFVSSIHDDGYPFETPHEQAMEMKQVSESFIDSSFQWGIKPMVEVYDQMNNEKEIQVQS